MATRDDEILERIRRRAAERGQPEREPEGIGRTALRFGRGVAKGAIDAPLALAEGAGRLGSKIDRRLGTSVGEMGEEGGALTGGIVKLRELNRRFWEQGGTRGADAAGEITGSLLGFGGAYRQAGKALSGALTSGAVARAAQGTGRAARAARGAEALGKTNRFWPSRLREAAAGAPLTIAMDAPEQETSTAYALGSLLEGGQEWNDPIAASLLGASETMPGRIATGVGFDVLGDVALSKGIDAFQARRAKGKSRQPRLADPIAEAADEAEAIAQTTPSPTLARASEAERLALEAEARADELEQKADPGKKGREARKAAKAAAQEARAAATKLRAEANAATAQAAEESQDEFLTRLGGTPRPTAEAPFRSVADLYEPAATPEPVPDDPLAFMQQGYPDPIARAVDPNEVPGVPGGYEPSAVDLDPDAGMPPLRPSVESGERPFIPSRSREAPVEPSFLDQIDRTMNPRALPPAEGGFLQDIDAGVERAGGWLDDIDRAAGGPMEAPPAGFLRDIDRSVEDAEFEEFLRMGDPAPPAAAPPPILPQPTWLRGIDRSMAEGDLGTVPSVAPFRSARAPGASVGTTGVPSYLARGVDLGAPTEAVQDAPGLTRTPDPAPAEGGGVIEAPAATGDDLAVVARSPLQRAQDKFQEWRKTQDYKGEGWYQGRIDPDPADSWNEPNVYLREAAELREQAAEVNPENNYGKGGDFNWQQMGLERHMAEKYPDQRKYTDEQWREGMADLYRGYFLRRASNAEKAGRARQQMQRQFLREEGIDPLESVPQGGDVQFQADGPTYRRTKSGFREVARDGRGVKGRTLSRQDMEILEREAGDPAYRGHRDRAASIRDNDLLVEASQRIARRAEAAQSEDARRLLLRESRAFLDEVASRGAEPRAGAVDPAVVSALARAGLGAAVGGTVGDTPEERVANALLLGGASLAAPTVAGMARRALQSADQAAPPRPGDPRRPAPSMRPVAESYGSRFGRTHGLRDFEVGGSYQEVPEDEAFLLADLMDKLPNDPTNPRIIASYDAMKREVLDQWNHLVSQGFRFEPWRGQGEPYRNSDEAIADLEQNKHLYFFLTKEGFGTPPEGAEVARLEGEFRRAQNIAAQARQTGNRASLEANTRLMNQVGAQLREARAAAEVAQQAYRESQAAFESHPLAQMSGVEVDGEPLYFNDLFRAVHDAMGHGVDGNQFGPRGEHNAWIAHARMFSDAARLALANETRAQNSWVNYGPHLRRADGTVPKRGDPDFVPLEQRPFADQKVIEIPEHLTHPPGSRALRRLEREAESPRLLARQAQAMLDEVSARGLEDRLTPSELTFLSGVVRSGMGATLGALASPEDRLSGALSGAGVGLALPAIGRLTRPIAEAAARSNSLYANPALDPDLYMAARQSALREYLLPQEAMSTGRFGFAMDAVRNLAPAQQIEFTREIEQALRDPDTGEDLIWKALGGQEGGITSELGEGMYLGEISPNAVHRIADTVSDDVVARYTAMKGLLMGQDSMVWARQVMEGTEGARPGYVLSAPEGLTPETYREMQQIVMSDEKFAPLRGSTFLGGSVLFRNFDDALPEGTYRTLLADMVQRIQSVPEIQTGEGFFTGAYYDGPADYLRAIGRDADTVQRSHDLLVERSAPVFEKWAGSAGGDEGATRARLEESARALDSLARGIRNAPDLTKIEGQGGRTNLDVARELRAKNPDIYDLPWEQQRPRILRLGMEDVRQARRELAHGGDWYDGSLQDAYALLPFKIPETRDPDQRSVFSMILALTSNNADVNPNWKRAVGIYDQFVKTGEITLHDTGDPFVDAHRMTNAERQKLIDAGTLPAEALQKKYAPGTMGSDKDNTIEVGLRRLDALVKERGIAGMRDFLVSPTQKKVRGFGSYQIPEAASRFGEKVGAFMSNVEGINQYVTTDKWLKRTWDGWMGRTHTTPRMFPVKGNKKKYEPRVDPETGETIVDLDDTVRPIEHAQVADVVQALAKSATEEFGEEISPSAVQGLLWYLEKHRYASLGAVESARESFHDAAVNDLLGRPARRTKSRARSTTPVGVALATALFSPEVAQAATGAAAGAAGADEEDGISEAALMGALIATGVGGRRLLKNPAARQAVVNGLSFVAPPDVLDKKGRAMSAFVRRNGTSAGDLPKDVFQSKIRNHGWIESQVHDVAYTIREFDKAAKESFGGVDSMTDSDIKLVDDALKGAVPVTSLPAPMQPVVTQMRTHIDALSRTLIDEGVVQGPLAATIESGIGFYAKRAYRIFDDPDWAQNVPADVKNRAIAYLRQEYPNHKEEEVQGILAELLFRGEEGPIAMIQKRKLGSKAMQTLSARKDIHPSIRALWGEYGDAQINYAKSVASMSQIIGNHNILKDAQQAGMGKWLFDGPIVQDGEEYAHQIAADGSKSMAPLNGLYTSKAIADAFSGAFDSPVQTGFLNMYMKVNGGVKIAKTVLSPQAQIRNLIGNIGFAVANGHTQGTKMLDAFKTVATNLGVNDYRQFQERYKRYLRLGVVATGTTEGELRDIVRDASRQGVSYLTNPVVSTPGKALKKSMQLYRASDDLWKIFAFENEVSRYRKVYPTWTQEQVDARAAEVVRNTYPNYDMVPNAIKMIRRIPLVGTFTSFPAEVVRTGYHTLKTAADEIKDPVTRAIGLQRAAGILAAATATTAAAITSRQLVGVTKEEEQDLRRFMAPWDKHAEFFHLGKDERGNHRFVNMGYTDPYSYLREPALALLAGDDWEGKLWEVGWMLAEPFAGEEILASRLIDVSRNKKKDTGGTVYNEQADLTTRFNDGLLYVMEAFEPGALTSGKRVYYGATDSQSESGRVYNVRDELLSLATGQRRQAVDARQGMQFKAREFQESMTEAQRIINRTLSDRSDVSPQEVASAYAETESARRRLFDNMHLDAQAAVRLGLSRQQVFDLLSQGGMSREMARRVIEGVYEPYTPSEQFIKSMLRSFRSAAATGEDVVRTRGEMQERMGALRREVSLTREGGAR